MLPFLEKAHRHQILVQIKAYLHLVKAKSGQEIVNYQADDQLQQQGVVLHPDSH